jgi:hypothetical protein
MRGAEGSIESQMMRKEKMCIGIEEGWKEARA